MVFSWIEPNCFGDNTIEKAAESQSGSSGACLQAGADGWVDQKAEQGAETPVYEDVCGISRE